MSLFCPVSVATLPFRPARSPAASLQTGAQRVTFGRSHQFSRLISFSSTWALTPSSNLLSLLESEIESSVINEDASDNDEFGDETILVLIDRPKVPQDDEELVFGIPMGVYVSKDDDGLRLKFGVKAFADEIVIDSVAVQQRRESKWSYQGPDIDDLDENLQKAFNKFLEIRGINPTITDFLADYLANKDKREHLRWLKDVKSFVDILKLSNKSETCK
ncbi:PREDICTED: uncharacterized protein At2g39795, mitochondrial-like isoform X2 [Brassica oleracea var. oleracea]|uniref:uncharacterized protein At2g39795, mitochondrial-like isoform X2 n=1 Tax=Brassica oleracea var. oleracea TaxID=109376 RepID=UPI0006A75578|nr:PREDICTED: uncharacterized protein At2g39795, mitochondrial-like isoform X2 [Brassica oleracea var. oleracea]